MILNMVCEFTVDEEYDFNGGKWLSYIDLPQLLSGPFPKYFSINWCAHPSSHIDHVLATLLYIRNYWHDTMPPLNTNGIFLLEYKHSNSHQSWRFSLDVCHEFVNHSWDMTSSSSQYLLLSLQRALKLGAWRGFKLILIETWWLHDPRCWVMILEYLSFHKLGDQLHLW